METTRTKDIIVLFDVDGPLTKARNPITQDMLDTLTALQKKHYIGVISGSDVKKLQEQLGKSLVERLDFTFSENGLYTLKEGKEFAVKSIKDELGEEKLKNFINFCLRYIADLDIPIKRGTFIEYRAGMLNVSPIGRNCSQEEREEFERYDREKEIRKKFVETLEKEFNSYNLQFAIGGQISFDVFPKGWDKTYCLRFLDEFTDVHFFGDKTFPGGNDYEIFSHERTKGHTVLNHTETIKELNELFLSK